MEEGGRQGPWGQISSLVLVVEHEVMGLVPCRSFWNPELRRMGRWGKWSGWDRGGKRPLRAPVPGWHWPGVLQALPPTRRNCVRATEEEVTPQHRLW